MSLRLMSNLAIALTLLALARSFRALFRPMKTFSAKASEVPRKWWIIDAARPGSGKSGGESCQSVTRQRKDNFYAPRRYRRFRDRHQCGKSAAYRKERGTEKLHEFFRITSVATNRRTPGRAERDIPNY